MSKNEIKEFGQATLENSKRNSKIHLLSIIGEIEGHEVLSGKRVLKSDALYYQAADAAEQWDAADLVASVGNYNFYSWNGQL